MNISVYKKTARGLNGGTCFYCGQPATSIDHYVPLLHGGLHVKKNIVPACDTCNLEKSDMDGDTFVRYIRRFGVPKRGWRLTTNREKIGTIYTILKFNKKQYGDPQSFVEQKFGRQLVQRTRNLMDNPNFSQNHNAIKKFRMNGGCVFCGGKHELKYERRMFICEPCRLFSIQNSITYDVLIRYIGIFGPPTPFKYNKYKTNYENNYRRNSNIMIILNFIWKHNNPIKFYKITSEKFPKHLIKRFIRRKKFRIK